MTDGAARAVFWDSVRARVEGLPADVPEAWAFGATKEHADDLLALVLAGTKTGTAASLWDHEATGEPLAAVGAYSIILDGDGVPRAVILTTAVEIVSFDAVTAEHARAEGEGDRTLAYWRDAHERFWRRHSESPRGFAPDMPVVCERFTLVFP